jgi:hypothetical protein
MTSDEGGTSNLVPFPIGGDLARTLSQLNGQWEQSLRKAQWRKFYLNDAVGFDHQIKVGDSNNDFVYLLHHPQPNIIILFTGGALLGQYPHVTYGFFLENLSRCLNATIIASSYMVSMDHWALAQKNLESFQQALVRYENEVVLNNSDPNGSLLQGVPIFMISHSLGAKLNLLSNVASPTFESLVRGHFILSFNNYGFSQTISMVSILARELQGDRNSLGDPSWFDMFVDVTKQAMDFAGLEFTPSPEETLMIVEQKYTKQIQSKTNLIVFDQDSLDCSEMFLQACRSSGMSTISIPGTHLTPAYIELYLNETESLGGYNEPWMSSLLGGWRAVSFGNETQTKLLIDVVSKCILRGYDCN